MSGAAEFVLPGVCEVSSVVGEDRVDLVGDGVDPPTREVARCQASHFLMQLDEGELRRSVDCDEQIEFAVRGSDFGDVDMELADRVSLEFLLGGGFAFDLRQPGFPVPLQTPMKRRSRQVRDGRRQGVQAVVERQQSMPPEGDDDGLFINRKDRRSR
jgi:hypothetical protein